MGPSDNPHLTFKAPGKISERKTSGDENREVATEKALLDEFQAETRAYWI